MKSVIIELQYIDFHTLFRVVNQKNTDYFNAYYRTIALLCSGRP